MAIIEMIKQKICQMEGGAFQAMCNEFLAKERSKIGRSDLGSQPGTMKTTKGTPDTYFVMDNGKYVFIEYTTQTSNLVKKIKKDLEKCFDEKQTRVPIEKISEIIYCHTSSNITPGDDLELREYCAARGTTLTLIGIDQIAEQLYRFHKEIAKDYLEIPIGTGQIKDSKQFIHDYDANKLSAPLSTEFQFRQEEVRKLENAFKQTNVVILSGRAGVGKSRLALHYAELHANQNSESLLCICANAQPIYEDLKNSINVPGKYFIFIDDANTLTGLQYVLDYVTDREPNYDVKILITVRDYASQSVINEVNEVTDFISIEVLPFSDEQIRNLSKNFYGIANEFCLERITEIAKGNARIAMLAGKIAAETNSLDTINDLTALFAQYYERALNGNSLFSNKKLLISAGVVAYLSPFSIDRIEPILPILEECNLSRREFVDALHALHDSEIIQIHYDNIVRFEEQCLSNFVLKLVFVDEKHIRVFAMAKACLENYFSKTIDALNAINGVFHSKDVQEYLESEIRTLWNELEREQKPSFCEFVKSFYAINQTKALLYVQELIKNAEVATKMPSAEELVKAKQVQRVDDILQIIGGFADTENLETALDLYFEYYKKCCGNFGQFYYLALSQFNVDMESWKYDYLTPRAFIKKLLQNTDQFDNEATTILFLELASEFLKLQYSSAKFDKSNKLTVYTIKLAQTEGLRSYRSEIWEALSRIDERKYSSYLVNVLDNYARDYPEESSEIICEEASKVIQLIEKVLSPENVKHCLIVDRIAGVFEEYGCLPENVFARYRESHVFNSYKLLNDIEFEIPVRKRQIAKNDRISKYVNTKGLQGVYELIDICSGFANELENTWNAREGLGMALMSLKKDPDAYIQAIHYYIDKNTPLDVRADEIVHTLLSNFDIRIVKQLIFGSDYFQKNAWEFAYFCEMPEEKITKEMVDDLYDYLRDDVDSNIKESGYRDICLLNKYSVADENAFINACELVYKKFEYSPFIANVYFSLMFNEHCHPVDEIMALFIGHYGLLSQIYVASIHYSRMDDLTGAFLVKLYDVYPVVMRLYSECIIEKAKQHCLNEYSEQLRTVYKLSNAWVLFDDIIEKIITQNEYPDYIVESFIKAILVNGKQELWVHQDAWIKHFIETYPHDKLRMGCLFDVISRMPIDNRIEYINLFLQQTQAFEDFETIPLIPEALSWRGSAIPMLSAYKDYLNKLLPNLHGIKFIRHKELVESKIIRLQKWIEWEQREDILRN